MKETLEWEMMRQAMTLRKLPRHEVEALVYIVEEYKEWKRLKGESK